MTLGTSPDSVVLHHGEIRPIGRSRTTPDDIVAFLRGLGLLAAAAGTNSDDLTRAAGLTANDLPILLCLAATPDRHVLLRTDDGVARGSSIAEFVVELARLTGHEVDVAGEYAAPPDEEEPQDDAAMGTVWVDMDSAEESRDVVLCRLRPEMLPILARHTGSPLTAYLSDGWTVVRFERENPDVHRHGWLADEGPVVALSWFSGTRYLCVLSGRGVLPGQASLTRLPRFSCTFTVEEVGPGAGPIVERLADPHLDPDSQLSALLALEPFAHLDPAAVSAALQSADDAGWFTRVLAALELPTTAADVLDGATLPDPIRIEPAGLWTSLRDSIRRSLADIGTDDVEPGRVRRLHEATVRQPLRMLWTAVPELLVGLPLLLWVLGSTERPWWMFLGGAVAVLLLLDAVADLVLMTWRLRRRHRDRRAGSPAADSP